MIPGVERGNRSFEQIILEGLVGEGGIGIVPGDDKHRIALLDGPFDEGILGLQVEDVIFVDPRRHDHQRTTIGCFAGRRVLEELDQIVLKDHLAGRDGDIVAEAEGVRVGHPDAQLAVAVFEIIEEIVEAAHQILAAALNGLAQDLGIGRNEVAGGHGIGELAGIELDLLGGLLVEAFDFADRRLHPAGGQQVGLLDVIKQEIVIPLGGLEAAVTLFRRNHGFGLAAQQALGGALPQGHIVLPQVHLRGHHLARIGHHLAGHLEKGLADLAGVGHAGAALLSGQEFSHDTLAARRDGGHVIGVGMRLGSLVLIAGSLGHGTSR